MELYLFEQIADLSCRPQAGNKLVFRIGFGEGRLVDRFEDFTVDLPAQADRCDPRCGVATELNEL